MFLLLALTFVVLGLVTGDRERWWRFYAWQYRDPEANEPSERALNANRKIGFGLAALMLVLGLWFAGSLWSADKESKRHQEEIDGLVSPSPTYDATAVRRKAETVAAALPGRTENDVAEIVARVAGDDLIVRPGRIEDDPRRGDGEDITGFRFSTPLMEESVCLVIRIDDSGHVPWPRPIKAAEVKDGGC